MLPNLTTIFPKVGCSQVVDLVDAKSIASTENECIKKLIESHLFGRSVQLFSSNPEIHDHVKRCLIDNEQFGYLYVKNVPVCLLIDPSFIETFVKKGKVYCVSVNRDVNHEDTVALLPSKSLLLSLNAETYYRLGLIGKESDLNRTKNITKKFRLNLDLLDETFVPEKRNYQRAYECLYRADLSCDFVFKWIPDDVNDQSSLENFFRHHQTSQKLTNLSIERCYPSIRTFQNNNTRVFNEKIDHSSEECENILNRYIEWCSKQLCEIEINIEDYESNSAPVQDTLYCVCLQGFFTSSDVFRLLESCASPLKSSELSCLIVNGFEDSPQCWAGKNNEHYKALDGTNMYGLGQIAQQNFVCSWALGDEYDYGIEKL